MFYEEEFRSQEPGVGMKLLVKTSSPVDEKGVETFPKTPSLYEWCILTPEF
jgi:hypothetical protein